MRTRIQKKQDSKKVVSATPVVHFSEHAVNPLLKFQQTLGNQAVLRLLDFKRIQAKLSIAQPDDKYEQQADTVAERIMQMPDSSKAEHNHNNLTNQIVDIQCQCQECEEKLQRRPTEELEEEEEEEPLQAKEMPGQAPQMSTELESTINSLRGGGQALSSSVRDHMEPRFERDFSGVRIHTDSQAAKVARSINARAFTLGEDIVFASGEYQPHSSEGKHLLAHELTHVLQQARKGNKASASIQKQENGWIIDKGKYFELKKSAERRKQKLELKYGSVDVFERTDGNWQCRYKAAQAGKKPAKGGKTGSPPKQASVWTIDKGKYYEFKDSAERRKAELEKKYATVDVFERTDGNWQCRYKAAQAGKKPAKGGKAGSPPKQASVWTVDKGKYYEFKDSAERRKAELEKKYATVDVFERKDGNWQCRYKATKAGKKPGKGGKAVPPPKSLSKFSAGIGTFTAAELNDALLTVFGEISARVTAGSEQGARAVASTIFNRKDAIDQDRITTAEALKDLREARTVYDSAKARVEELGTHPTKYKKQMGAKKYKEALKKAQSTFKDARKKLGAAQTAANTASSRKISSESYIQKKYRKQKTVTLTMIVNDVNQYEGYPKGKKDHANYPKMSDPDKRRNAERWKIAKDALRDLAKNKKLRKKFIQFRSNLGGKRQLSKGETRIEGNDFW